MSTAANRYKHILRGAIKGSGFRVIDNVRLEVKTAHGAPDVLVNFFVPELGVCVQGFWQESGGSSYVKAYMWLYIAMNGGFAGNKFVAVVCGGADEVNATRKVLSEMPHPHEVMDADQFVQWMSKENSEDMRLFEV